MKKLLSIVLSLCMIFSITAGLNLTACAETLSGKCGDNLTWKFSNETLTISGNGKMDDYYIYTYADFEMVYGDVGDGDYCEDDVHYVDTSVYAPWYKFKGVINKIIIEDGVTSIGKFAFDHMSVKTLVLPKSIKEIKSRAFTNHNIDVYYNGSLNDWVNISFSGNYYRNEENDFDWTSTSNPIDRGGRLFINNELVTKIIVNCENVNCFSFYNYKYVTEVCLSEGVKKLSADTFVGCSNIKKFELPCSLNRCICDGEYDYFPNGVTEISVPANNVAICRNVKIINLKGNFTDITSDMIDNHRSTLEKITIPDGVKYIGDGAFKDCKKLKRMFIPNSVTRIEYNAFSGTDLTIVGYKDSFVENYCKMLGIPFEVFECTHESIIIDKAIPATYVADGKTKGSHCSVCNAVITPQKTVAKKKLKTPSISSLKAGKKAFTLKWKKVTDATGYEIKYSTSSKFTKKTTKTVTVKSAKTTSKTIKKLTAKKRYYVQIRAYKTVKVNGKSTKVYSGWTKTKNVTTKK